MVKIESRESGNLESKNVQPKRKWAIFSLPTRGRVALGASKNKDFFFFDRPHPGLPPEGEGAKPRRLKIVSDQVGERSKL
jgi:hypothetical protein